MFGTRYWGDRYFGPRYWGKGAVAFVTVPDVDNPGTTQAAAVAAIEGVGLVAAVATQYNSTVPAGEVISQDPAAGSSVAPGSTVTIQVSMGPQPAGTGSNPGGGGGGGGKPMRFEPEERWREWAPDALQFFANQGKRPPKTVKQLIAQAPTPPPTKTPPPAVRKWLAEQLAGVLEARNPIVVPVIEPPDANPLEIRRDLDDDDEEAIFLLM